MKLTVLTITTDWHTENPIRVEKWTVEGETLKDCFEAAYPTERSYRYCNDTNIRFENPEVHEKYLDWKKNGMTFEMFYGNATVD